MTVFGETRRDGGDAWHLASFGLFDFPRDVCHIPDRRCRLIWSHWDSGANCRSRPWIQPVEATCGGNAIGGILTGMGSDGAAGLLTLAQKGSATFAQDEETSLIFGMPKVALELGAARQSLALQQISDFLCATRAAGKLGATGDR